MVCGGTSMQKWYSGKNILVTGGTGFMGKVLLEKMLRSVPNLGNIFLLVRPKKGLTPEERLAKIKELPIFERLLRECPAAINKLVWIEADLTEDNLGLTEGDSKRLIREVNVVFHMAASLRLEAGVKEAVLANTLGTIRVMELCKKIEKLLSVVHLSTAFCHCDQDVLEEKLYKPHIDPYDVIELVDSTTDEELNFKKMEIISPHPNSYTFSKRLAEWVVKDYEANFPLVVARPSIVIPSLEEPLPGWVDSLNGPVGIMVAGGKGVLFSMLGQETNHAVVIPVDIAINSLISSAYLRTLFKEKESIVMNVTVPKELLEITWKEVLEKGRTTMAKYPLEWMLWYPYGSMRTNFFIHWLIIILFQWIPAVLLDTLFFLIRKERFMILVQKKISIGMEVLQYFTLKEWSIETTKSTEIMKHLDDADHEIFPTIKANFDVEKYFSTCILGIRKYCLKEDLKTLPITRIHFKILYVLHHVCLMVLIYFVVHFGIKFFVSVKLLSDDWIPMNLFCKIAEL